MSEIVSFEYYNETYMGTEAGDDFYSLNAHAARTIAALTRYRVTADNIDSYPALIAENYRNAVCAQIDFYAVNGLDYASAGTDRGFTVGKVSVQGKSNANAGGAMSGSISPAALLYLEQTGLMNPSVPAYDWRW